MISKKLEMILLLMAMIAAVVGIAAVQPSPPAAGNASPASAYPPPYGNVTAPENFPWWRGAQPLPENSYVCCFIPPVFKLPDPFPYPGPKPGPGR